MTVLVVGATGTVGPHLVHALAALGRPPGTVEDHLAAHPDLAVAPLDAS